MNSKTLLENAVSGTSILTGGFVSIVPIGMGHPNTAIVVGTATAGVFAAFVVASISTGYGETLPQKLKEITKAAFFSAAGGLMLSTVLSQTIPPLPVETPMQQEMQNK